MRASVSSCLCRAGETLLAGNEPPGTRSSPTLAHPLNRRAQAQAIERISEEALRDMQTLPIELRPASLDGAGLGPALQDVCAAYRDRLGVTVDRPDGANPIYGGACLPQPRRATGSQHVAARHLSARRRPHDIHNGSVERFGAHRRSRPKPAKDVAEALRVCREHDVPVIARGCDDGRQHPERCARQIAEAMAWDGPVIIGCVVDEHEPPYPAKVKKDQVKKLATALREGTPNRRRIALQMVRDLLDESSFEASPAHVVPRPAGKAAAKLTGKLRGNGQE